MTIDFLDGVVVFVEQLDFMLLKKLKMHRCTFLRLKMHRCSLLLQTWWHKRTSSRNLWRCCT